MAFKTKRTVKKIILTELEARELSRLAENPIKTGSTYRLIDIEVTKDPEDL